MADPINGNGVLREKVAEYRRVLDRCAVILRDIKHPSDADLPIDLMRRKRSLIAYLREAASKAHISLDTLISENEE